MAAVQRVAASATKSPQLRTCPCSHCAIPCRFAAVSRAQVQLPASQEQDSATQHSLGESGWVGGPVDGARKGNVRALRTRRLRRARCWAPHRSKAAPQQPQKALFGDRGSHGAAVNPSRCWLGRPPAECSEGGCEAAQMPRDTPHRGPRFDPHRRLGTRGGTEGKNCSATVGGGCRRLIGHPRRPI